MDSDSIVNIGEGVFADWYEQGTIWSAIFTV